MARRASLDARGVKTGNAPIELAVTAQQISLYDNDAVNTASLIKLTERRAGNYDRQQYLS